jgi:molecular chaperone GrpE (heat shock protein)
VTVPDDDVRPAPDSDAGGQLRETDAPLPEATPEAAGERGARASGDADTVDGHGPLPSDQPAEVSPTPAGENPQSIATESALAEPAIPAEPSVREVEAAASEPAAPRPATTTAGEPAALQPAATTAEPAAQQPAAQQPGATTAEPAASTAEPAVEPAASQPAAGDSAAASELAGILATLSSVGSRVDEVAATAAELARLRTRDTDLIARLHDDVTRLRTGEIATALNPVVAGMIKLHDQMVSLGALDDQASPVGMLHTQLLQTMELTCAVKPFAPAPGERFDPSRHTGTRRIPTTDPSADGTIAGTIRAGFARADGSVVRVAEVEVHRLSEQAP